MDSYVVAINGWPCVVDYYMGDKCQMVGYIYYKVITPFKSESACPVQKAVYTGYSMTDVRNQGPIEDCGDQNYSEWI